MREIRCLIADDELLAREVLQSYLARLPQARLMATCASGLETYTALAQQEVDLLFLDIQMPQLTGIELLRTLQKAPPVILTTAHREFALEGYELNVLDYLLKPISFERFLKAFHKFELMQHPGQVLSAPAPIPVKTERPAFIYVKADKKMVRLLLDDILFIEGMKDYVKVHTPTATVITYQTLSYFEEKLPADQFLRIHRSFIVSMSRITAYTASYVEIGTCSLPVGQSYLPEVQRYLRRE